MLTLKNAGNSRVNEGPPTPVQGEVGPLHALVSPEDYRAQRTHLYPSQQSFNWFVRKHRNELLAAGAWIKPAGAWLVSPDAFDQAVLSIGMRCGRAA